MLINICQKTKTKVKEKQKTNPTDLSLYLSVSRLWRKVHTALRVKAKRKRRIFRKKMLRVAGRRLSSLTWRSSQSQTTSAFVSRNTAFVSDDGRDSAASSRPILSPYQFSFPPDLIRGHLFLSSDLGLASLSLSLSL